MLGKLPFFCQVSLIHFAVFSLLLYSPFLLKRKYGMTKKQKQNMFQVWKIVALVDFFFSVTGTGCYGNGNNIISLQYSLLFLSIFPFIHFFSSHNIHKEKRFIFFPVSPILSRWMCECHLVWRRPYHWKSMKNIVVKKSVQKFENKFFNGCPSYHSRDWMSRKLRNN